MSSLYGVADVPSSLKRCDKVRMCIICDRPVCRVTCFALPCLSVCHTRISNSKIRNWLNVTQGRDKRFIFIRPDRRDMRFSSTVVYLHSAQNRQTTLWNAHPRRSCILSLQGFVCKPLRWKKICCLALMFNFLCYFISHVRKLKHMSPRRCYKNTADRNLIHGASAVVCRSLIQFCQTSVSSLWS